MPLKGKKSILKTPANKPINEPLTEKRSHSVAHMADKESPCLNIKKRKTKPSSIDTTADITDVTQSTSFVESQSYPLMEGKLTDPPPGEDIRRLTNLVECPLNANEQALLDFSTENLNQWALSGFEMINEFENLVKRAILARIKLNSKFHLLQQTINLHAKGLESHATALEAKSKKIGNMSSAILQEMNEA